MRLLTVIIMLVFSSPLHAQFYTIRREQPIQITKPIQEKQQGKEDVSESLEASSQDITDSGTLVGLETLNCSLPLERDLYITSAYGYRLDPITKKKRFHYGIDLQCKNDKVLSIFWGEVKKVGYSKYGLGNYVVLSHKVFEITYGHLEYVLVEKGDKVRPGMIVGISGNTGRSTGHHLHLEMKYRGKKCDPLPLLAFIDKTVKLQNKVADRIMSNHENAALTALEHVQEAYSEEYALFLEEEGKLSSEETALLFLEAKEEELLASSNNKDV